MSDEHDDDLRALFAHQRRCDQDAAPAWSDRFLTPPPVRFPTAARRWIPISLAAACVFAMAAFFAGLFDKPEPALSEALPPLFDAPPSSLFAGIEPSFTHFEAPSDFLLPAHLNFHLP